MWFLEREWTRNVYHFKVTNISVQRVDTFLAIFVFLTPNSRLLSNDVRHKGIEIRNRGPYKNYVCIHYVKYSVRFEQQFFSETGDV